jgi:hypothetical protein
MGNTKPPKPAKPPKPPKPPQGAGMALALDGSVSGTFSQTGSKVVALTTTQADDVIIVIVANEKNTADNSFTTVTSITDVAGLTWTRRSQTQWVVTSGSVTRQCLEVWWAHAPGALSADNITVNCANTDNTGVHPLVTDDSCVVAFGVSGANFTSPFDGNGSLPAQATDVTGSNVARQVTGISTTNTNTFMLAAMANSFNQSATTPTGFTNIASPSNAGGSLFEYLATDYKVQSAAQSGITVTEGSNGQNWGMVVDAIKEATSEVDIPSAGTIANGMGFSQAAVIQGEKDLTAAPGIGFSEAAVVQLERDLVAALDFGFAMDASFDDAQHLTSSQAFGFDVATTLIAESYLSAAPSFGFSVAATLSLERQLTIAPSLGFSEAASFRSNRKRQPVICVVS